MSSSFTLQDISIVEACPLSCQNNSTCLPGEAGYVGYPHQLNSALPALTALQITNVNGYYCRCQGNFTGVDCSEPVASCGPAVGGIESSAVSCYHGGTCVREPLLLDEANNLLLVCNCSQAQQRMANGSIQYYGGVYCEVPIQEQEYCASSTASESPAVIGAASASSGALSRHSQLWYCLNGGTCQNVVGNLSTDTWQSCSCADGFVGQHCEVQLSLAPPSDDASTSQCTLPCMNGGVCQHGWTANSKVSSQRVAPPQMTMSCSCPNGYIGVLCQNAVDQCGSDLICLHGDTCQAKGNISSITYTTRTVNKNPYTCVTNGFSPSVISADVQWCSPNLTNILEYVEGMAVPSFCVNGGICQDTALLGEGNENKFVATCVCPDSFFGPHCEFTRNAWDLMSRLQAVEQETAEARRGILLKAATISLGLFFVALALLILWWTGCAVRCIAWLRRAKYKRRTSRRGAAGGNDGIWRQDNNEEISSTSASKFGIVAIYKRRKKQLQQQTQQQQETTRHITNLHDIRHETGGSIIFSARSPAFLKASGKMT